MADPPDRSWKDALWTVRGSCLVAGANLAFRSARHRKMAGFSSIKKPAAAAVISLALTAIAVWGSANRILYEFEAVTWSWRLRIAAERIEPDPRIKIIAVDQSSLDWGKSQAVGALWPWPRQIYAAVIGYLRAAGARAAAFDVLFTEPSAYNVSDDRLFAEALTGLPVVSALSLDAVPRSSGAEELQILRAKQSALLKIGSAPDRILAGDFPEAQFPIPEVMRSSAAFGAVNQNTAGDELLQRYMPVFSMRGLPIYSLPAALYVVGTGREVPWKHFDFDRNGSLALRYAGPQSSFATYSIKDIINSFALLNDGQAPKVPLEEFRDSLVFIGYTAPGTHDHKRTPLDEAMPGVEINATVLDNILNNRFVSALDKYSAGAAVFMLGICAVLPAFYATALATVLAFALGAMTLYLLLAFALAINGVWAPLFLPLICAAVGLTVALGIQYFLEGSRRRFLKMAFRHYVSAELIEQIIERPEALALGGERRTLTIFFSDIAGFTGFSEKLDAPKLASLLNEFLTEMTDIIQRHSGTVDKYVGDAIVAFWNAPLSMQDHAAAAVRAALECQERLEVRRPEWESRYGVTIRMRIGLNTGEVHVGNFGSQSRFNYTMIGDAANLASRLEGANKEFGTYIMASRTIVELAPEAAAYRRIGAVQVVGRNEAVEIYEPLTAKEYQELRADGFEEALQRFESGDRSGAREFFKRLAGRDPVSQKYLERIDNEGAEERSAVWRLEHK